MAAEIQEITSLKRAPDGWEPRASRDGQAAPHPSVNSRSKTTIAGPREDAEPTAELPTLTPGISRLPTTCMQCGSAFLTRRPPLGSDRRGMVTCNTCGRQVCWLRPDIRATRGPSAASPTPGAPPATTAPPARTLRPVIQGRFQREGSCGRACSVLYGHDPDTHEEYGWNAALAASRTKPTGVVRTGPLTIDFDNATTTVDGERALLTPTEQRLLEALATRCGQLYPLTELVETVWGHAMALAEAGRDDRISHSHLVSVNIARARAKLGAARDLIETRPSRGLLLRKELTS